MATRIIPNVSEGTTAKITVEFDNGDLEALDAIVRQWRFLNRESALRFALAVLTRARNGVVFVTDEAGNRSPVMPSAGLLQPPSPQ